MEGAGYRIGGKDRCVWSGRAGCMVTGSLGRGYLSPPFPDPPPRWGNTQEELWIEKKGETVRCDGFCLSVHQHMSSRRHKDRLAGKPSRPHSQPSKLQKHAALAVSILKVFPRVATELECGVKGKGRDCGDRDSPAEAEELGLGVWVLPAGMFREVGWGGNLRVCNSQRLSLPPHPTPSTGRQVQEKVQWNEGLGVEECIWAWKPKRHVLPAEESPAGGPGRGRVFLGSGILFIPLFSS